MNTSAPGFRAQLRILSADPFIRGWLVVTTAVAVLWATPVLPATWRDPVWCGLNGLLAAGSALACILGVRRLTLPRERRFWILLGSGFGVWALVELASAIIPTHAWTPALSTAADTLFLLYYAPLLIAIDAFGTPEAQVDAGTFARWIHPAAFAMTTVGWVSYAIILPLAASGVAEAPDWWGYIVLDCVVIGALASASRRNRSARWVILRNWLLVAFIVAGIFDMADGFIVGRLTGLSGPSDLAVLPFFWAIPHAGFVAAARLRRGLPASAATVSPQAAAHLIRHASDTSLLVLAAFSLPVTHILAQVTDMVPSDTLGLQGVVVTLTSLVIGALAATKYHLQEVERTALSREREELEALLLQMRKMEAIGRLSGGIAHDFNNLLTAIGGYADIVLEGLSDDDPTATALRRVQTSVEHASALTKQLLSVGRRQILNPETVDLNEVIRDVPYAHRHLLGERIELRFDLDERAAAAWVDATHLEQVLLNLIVNARDAMPAGGVIRVSTSRVTLDDGAASGWPESKGGNYIRVEVSDRGGGIPPHVLPHVFDPFFTTKPAGRGTGLGLSVVYGIVRQCGGRITLVSTVGKGTTAVLDLPVADRVGSLRTPAARNRAASGTETILVAEDEAAVRELVRSMLSLGGYRVLMAGSGEEALDIEARFSGHIDLLLSDVVMPGINGRQLAERVLAKRPGTKVLLMTGYTDDAMVQRGVQRGALSLLPKPFTRQALLDTVRDILDQPAPVGGRP